MLKVALLATLLIMNSTTLLASDTNETKVKDTEDFQGYWEDPGLVIWFESEKQRLIGVLQTAKGPLYQETLKELYALKEYEKEFQNIQPEKNHQEHKRQDPNEELKAPNATPASAQSLTLADPSILAPATPFTSNAPSSPTAATPPSSDSRRRGELALLPDADRSANRGLVPYSNALSPGNFNWSQAALVAAVGGTVATLGYFYFFGVPKWLTPNWLRKWLWANPSTVVTAAAAPVSAAAGQLVANACSATQSSTLPLTGTTTITPVQETLAKLPRSTFLRTGHAIIHRTGEALSNVMSDINAYVIHPVVNGSKKGFLVLIKEGIEKRYRISDTTYATLKKFFTAAGEGQKFDFEVVKEGVWLNYAGSHTGEFISSGHIPQQSNFLDFINFVKSSK